MNSITGTVQLRPVRLGFVASEVTTQAVVEAARLASGVWGGLYFPIFRADDPDVLNRAEALAVDVLHPLDESQVAKSLCEAPGFRWRGSAQWGPFGSDSSDYRRGLLPIDRLLDTTASEWKASWSDDDRASVYGVWLGDRVDDDHLGRASPSLDDLWATGDPFVDSPIARTASLVEYFGDHTGLSIVLVGDDPVDLVRLWNLRACGGAVHPWLLGCDDESLKSAEAWLSEPDVVAQAHRARRGDGTELGPVVNVVAGHHRSEADPIRAAIEGLGFHASIGDRGLIGGWRGHHPLTTPVERDLNLSVEPDTRHVNIALPALPLLDARRSHMPGTVAADIVVNNESETSSGRTLALPGLRPLAKAIDNLTLDLEPFHRPSGEGRVVGVQANATSVSVALVPAMSIFESVLPEEAKIDQSDDGRFATHFIDRLGGVHSMAASQPSVRQVLYDLSNADRSRPIARLIRTARDHRGDWPDKLARQSPADYAKSVVYTLANTGLIVPRLSLRCPRCSTETDVRPDDLSTDMRCVVCRQDFNLGLALALQRQRDPWRYQLAGHLPPGRVRSGLAVMAANAVVRTAYRAGGAPAVPHVFGLTVELRGWSCEVDLAALIPDGPLTLAVVGELKGGRDTIDEADVKNLQQVQKLFRSEGIETFHLAGTTRDRLNPLEIEVLRAACETSPLRLIGSNHALALPIVLCGRDMSMPWMNEGHPWRWGAPGGPPFAGLTEVGCQRNLGLAAGEPKWVPAEGRWTFRWLDDFLEH